MSSAIGTRSTAKELQNNTKTSPLAGRPESKELLPDVTLLEREYFERQPDVADPSQLVSFGTSGHRGSRLNGTFTEAHIIAIAQAICNYRRSHGVDGNLYRGRDTHALSGPAQRTTLEVLAGNGVDTIVQKNDGVMPTPVISRSILVYNRVRKDHFGDGIVITPSHNPPRDGGIKYNPPNGGPADTEVTQSTEACANELLPKNNVGVNRRPYAAATTHPEDFVLPSINDLRNVVAMEAIRDAGIRLGVDPLGGAAQPSWEPINSLYGLDIAVTNLVLDPTFSFMTVDHDGEVRMDCSSPYAMACMVGLHCCEACFGEGRPMYADQHIIDSGSCPAELSAKLPTSGFDT